jgi:diamine N-acetyltransferase
MALQVAPEQRPLIASNEQSLSQASANAACVPIAVCLARAVVGFLMYEPRGKGVVSLHRFMVDHRYQRRGIGLSAMHLLIEQLNGEGVQTIYLSFRPENRAARHLYDRLGFVGHEIEPDGEVVYRLGPPREIVA